MLKQNQINAFFFPKKKGRTNKWIVEQMRFLHDARKKPHLRKMAFLFRNGGGSSNTCDLEWVS